MFRYTRVLQEIVHDYRIVSLKVVYDVSFKSTCTPTIVLYCQNSEYPLVFLSDNCAKTLNYTDHLKARNAMRYYDVEKETSPSTRTPLQLLQTKNGGEVDFNIREDHVTILEKEASLSFQEVKRRKQESEKRSRTSSLKQKVRQRVTVKRSRSQSLLGTYFKPTASPGASPGASPP